MFQVDGEARGFTLSTQAFYAQRLGAFLTWCEGQNVVTFDQLTAPVIRRFLAELQARNLSSAYIHSHARAVKTFCRFAAREGLCEVSPFARVKMPRLEKKVLPALSGDDVRAVLAACETERDRAIVLVMLDTGIRAAELVALDAGDVGADRAILVHHGKGRKERVTYFGAQTQRQLTRYFRAERGGRPAPTEPLFISQRGGGRLTYFGLAQIFKRLRKASGVRNLAPHALRRTMALHSLRAGMDVYTLAAILGHADIQVLRVYLDLVRADVQTAARKFGVVDGLLK